MRAQEADTSFESQLRSAGIDINDTVPKQGFDALLEFYRSVRATDCKLKEDGDMLLYQWGTYGKDKERRFDLNLTRQFIPGRGRDRDMWQLHLTYRYRPSGDLDLLGKGNKWCPHPDKVDEFATIMQSSAPLVKLGRLRPVAVILQWGQV